MNYLRCENCNSLKPVSGEEMDALLETKASFHCPDCGTMIISFNDEGYAEVENTHIQSVFNDPNDSDNSEE